MWSSGHRRAGRTVKTNGVPSTRSASSACPSSSSSPTSEAGIGGFANFASATVGGGSVSATKFSFMVHRRRGRGLLPRADLLGAEARYMYITEQTFDWGAMKLSGVTITANVGYVF